MVTHQQSGFTYMGVLMIVTISSIGMAGAGIVWHHEAQRAREKEFKFIGKSYQRAFASYFNKHKQFPKKLADLLLDDSVTKDRHIRKLYHDPMTRAEWGLIKVNGGITGVVSLSENEMLDQVTFTVKDIETLKYSDVKFTYISAEKTDKKGQSEKDKLADADASSVDKPNDALDTDANTAKVDAAESNQSASDDENNDSFLDDVDNKAQEPNTAPDNNNNAIAGDTSNDLPDHVKEILRQAQEREQQQQQELYDKYKDDETYGRFWIDKENPSGGQ